MEERKGKLLSWSVRGFGMVVSNNNELFYLHFSNIAKFPYGTSVPTPGLTVHFEAAPPRNGGKYRQALKAIISVEGAEL